MRSASFCLPHPVSPVLWWGRALKEATRRSVLALARDANGYQATTSDRRAFPSSKYLVYQVPPRGVSVAGHRVSDDTLSTQGCEGMRAFDVGRRARQRGRGDSILLARR